MIPLPGAWALHSLRFLPGSCPTRLQTEPCCSEGVRDQKLQHHPGPVRNAMSQAPPPSGPLWQPGPLAERLGNRAKQKRGAFVHIIKFQNGDSRALSQTQGSAKLGLCMPHRPQAVKQAVHWVKLHSQGLRALRLCHQSQALRPNSRCKYA